jgi:hypothetical protein
MNLSHRMFVTPERITVTLSVREVQQIFMDSEKNNYYICHALYSCVKSHIAKVPNLINVNRQSIPYVLSYYSIAQYEQSRKRDPEHLQEFPLTFSEQVMKWVQENNNTPTNLIHEILEDVPAFQQWGDYDGNERALRIRVLKLMVENQATDLTFSIPNISTMPDFPN